MKKSMFLKKVTTILVLYTFIFAGCATKQGHRTVGPQSSSALYQTAREEILVERPKIDIIIPVFDPGLPEDPDDYDDEVWPELRRAEANRFAYKLKGALEETGQFGAVRVTPDSTATGDIYVLGRIEESNGEDVEIDIEVVDISGRTWLDESYDHEVSEAFYQDLRNDGKDAYEPLFMEVAADIVEELDDYDDKELEDLHFLADMRFGANFSDVAFSQYIQRKGTSYSLVSKPSKEDPMLRRVQAIRVRDQLFIDGVQENYAAFSQQMDESYLMWQEQSLFEIQAQRAADRATLAKGIGGAVLIGLAVLSAVAGANSNSVGSTSAGAAGAILGGVAGAALLGESFKTSDEAEVHREALNELGQSVNMEFAPQVIAFEKQSVELHGDAQQQFGQWRDFLQRIYAEEMTPDVQL